VEFDDVSALRRHSPAWKLLRADNAPLVVSFLGRIFVEENARSISGTELVSRLDDTLYALNERLGEGTFPKSAKAYLEDWASPDAGWLRKYYPAGSDEPHFDATPAVEKALSWIKSLQTRSFVGTESRLNTIFALLQEMVFGAETDPAVRLAQLHRRRRGLDEEIAQVSAGQMAVLDASAQRDRYQQFAATARELLSDFREVEANLRALDRDLRERIAAWSGSKGELLDDVLGSRELIADSDQGRSFRAFYDLLLSHQKQAELSELLQRVQSLDAIDRPDPRMRRIHYDWLDAGERTQATVRQLSEQLRRFLDDQVWFENRRVMDILRSIESTALKLRDEADVTLTTEIDGTAPTLVLPMERPLYAPIKRTQLDSASIEASREVFDASTLFEQIYVDPTRLCLGVRRALQRRRQVRLAQLVKEQPLEQGLAELVTYLSLTDDGFHVVFDEQTREQVSWRDDDGRERVVTLPRVTFARTTPAHSGGGR
jgi:flagellar motility protein MotE (MotC chaperone)